MINLWHGKLLFNLNPNLYIKQKVLGFNLKEDLKVGMNKSCGFGDMYLKNSIFDSKSYHLVETFKLFNFFSSAKARCLIIKVLLYPRVFKVDCNFCNDGFINIFDHYVYNCDYLTNQREHLRNMLIFYSFPRGYFVNKSMFLTTCLEKRLWTKCLTDFLEDAKY